MKKILLFTTLLILNLALSSCMKGFSPEIPDPGEGEGSDTRLIIANYFNGIYYGEEYAPGVGNYWFYLSNNGFSNDEYIPDSYYYRIDLYGPVSTSPNSITIPDGIYTYDTNNTYAEYTFSKEYSCLIEVNDKGVVTETPFDNAQFVVNNGELNLYVTIGGVDKQIKFNKEYALEDGRENPNPPVSGDGYSTLTDDYQVNFVSSNARLDYAGDWWNCGFDNYTLYIMSKEGGVLNGDTILLDFITQYTGNNGGIAGNYTGTDTAAPMVYMYGCVQYNIPVGCWYFKYQYESIVEQAPITSGTLTITQNDNGTYTIDLDAYDDAATPNRITAHWTGDIAESNTSSLQAKRNFVELR